jgi:hypothetical protein
MLIKSKSSHIPTKSLDNCTIFHDLPFTAGNMINGSFQSSSTAFDCGGINKKQPNRAAF